MPLQLDVSTPVTSFTNLPVAESGGTKSAEMPAIAIFAIRVRAISMSCFGMLSRYRRQYAILSIDGGQGSPMGICTEYPIEPAAAAGMLLISVLICANLGVIHKKMQPK
jgi:hypothetical protein